MLFFNEIILSFIKLKEIYYDKINNLTISILK